MPIQSTYYKKYKIKQSSPTVLSKDKRSKT